MLGRVMVLGTLFIVLVSTGCDGDQMRYSLSVDPNGNTYRIDTETGAIHQIVDGQLIEIATDHDAIAGEGFIQRIAGYTALPSSQGRTFAALDVVEDFEIVISFLDGGHHNQFGEYGLEECLRSMPIDDNLSVDYARAQIANTLVSCIDQVQWFVSDRPVPAVVDSDTPICGEGETTLPSGATYCVNESESQCSFEQYLGNGAFRCKSNH